MSRTASTPATGRLSFAPRFTRLAGFLVASVLSASTAVAQPGGLAPTDEDTKKAEMRWQQGSAAVGRGDYEAARTALADAYEIVRYPALLLALGDAEAHTGRYVAAARHLSDYLKTTDGSSGQRASGERSLTRALQHVGSILVETDIQGAEIAVDGAIIGATPLHQNPWYVASGVHVVRVAKGGYRESTSTVDLREGDLQTVYPHLQPMLAMGAPPLAAEPSPSGSPASGSGPNPTRTAVVISGVAVSTIAFAVGGIYALKSASDRDRQEQLRAQIGGLGPSACLFPAAAVVASCADLARTVVDAKSNAHGSTGFFVAGALVGAATVGALVLWPARGAKGTTGLHVVPVDGGWTVGILGKL